MNYVIKFAINTGSRYLQCFPIEIERQPHFKVYYNVGQIHPIYIVLTRKYPLRGYILGVLTHSTAWDRHRGQGETLEY